MSAPQPPPPVWEAALLAVASAERGAVRAWEALVPLMLAPYPTRAAAEAARPDIEAALGRAYFTPQERELLAQRGVRGLPADMQKAKVRAMKKMSDCWSTLVDKWLFPESATVAVSGCFWKRNEIGYGVQSVERALPQAAAQEPLPRTGARRERDAAPPTMLERISAFGPQPPAKVWELHDRGAITDGCGGWRQFRAVFAAPSSYGKSFLAKSLLRKRMLAMAADLRGTSAFAAENIVLFSATGAGWEELPKKQVRPFSPETLREVFEAAEARALAAKTERRVPPPFLFIFDDVAGLPGVDRDPIIDRLFTQSRHFKFSAVLIGQTPRGLVNPTRKNNASLYFFGNFGREPDSNKPFAAAAGASLTDYNAWTRSNLGKKNGYVFGCMLEESVETGEAELPFILVAASVPVPRAEPVEPVEPAAAASSSAAAAAESESEGEFAAEPNESNGIDYTAESRRLDAAFASLMAPDAAADADADADAPAPAPAPPPSRHSFGFYANAAARPAGTQDLYETPRHAVLHVFPLIPADVKTIWECCYGNGAIYNVLAEAKDELGYQRYRLVGTDLFTEAPDGKGDFLTMEPPAAPYDMIITNPPYNNKVEWVKKLVATGKPWLILFPLTAMAGVGLSALWTTIGAKFFILTHTPRFLHAGRDINIGECVWIAGNGAAAAFPALNWLPPVPASI